MTTQQLKTLREKLNNMPDDILEKVADVLILVLEPYKDQHILDEWKKINEGVSNDEKYFSYMATGGIECLNAIYFHNGFKAAEKYHGIL